MTAADLEACRAAFPALTWSQDTSDRAWGRGYGFDVYCWPYPAGRGAQAWVSSRSRVDVYGEGSSVVGALTALRQAMTAVRDDLTAALGEP